MKRVIIKSWDAVNGKLSANYYKIGENMITLNYFESPLMKKSPEDCKGEMFKKGGPLYFGKSFIAEIHSLLTY